MGEYIGRMLKKAVQQGRRRVKPEAYPLGYVEDLTMRERSWRTFSGILLCFGFAVVQMPMLPV